MPSDWDHFVLILFQIGKIGQEKLDSNLCVSKNSQHFEIFRVCEVSCCLTLDDGDDGDDDGGGDDDDDGDDGDDGGDDSDGGENDDGDQYPRR